MTGSVTFTCWGCNMSEVHPWNGPGLEFDALLSDLEFRGWRRRSFGQSYWDKGPWFCSHECANYSHNAMQAEEYWQSKTFQGYCKQTRIPIILWFPLLLVISYIVGFYLARL